MTSVIHKVEGQLMLLMTAVVLHLKDNVDISVILVPMMTEMVGQIFAENCFQMV